MDELKQFLLDLIGIAAIIGGLAILRETFVYYFLGEAALGIILVAAGIAHFWMKTR